MTGRPGVAVTVVVVTFNGAHLLRPCLESLAAQTVPHEVVVVDNASQDHTPQVLADFPDVQVVWLERNTGFAGGAQTGLECATTEFVAFLNNDATAEPGWLAALVQPLLQDPTVAGSTSRILLTADGRINNAGGAMTRWGAGYDRGYGEPDGPPFDEPTDVGFLCGGGCLVRTGTARTVGGFPVEFFLYYEDTDLSWRLGLAGHRIRYTPGAVVHHLHSASSDQSSVLFAFHNQRNQLLTLVRNAPPGLVLVATARFLAITVLRMIRPGDGHSQRATHRWRVLVAVGRMLPGALAARRRAGRLAVVPRRAFRRRWVG
ncbi:glycosyltransferase family 2 protein [Nakamurella sp.]|uniref:glycosyltransferase family 2 protein n=1 Tax=Nakamurella sp. TaxID=1869182 RepID=UPI003782E505